MPDSNRTAGGLPSAEVYRQKALELCATANKTSDPFIRAEVEGLALVYMQLADVTQKMTDGVPGMRDRNASPEGE